MFCRNAEAYSGVRRMSLLDVIRYPANTYDQVMDTYEVLPIELRLKYRDWWYSQAQTPYVEECVRKMQQILLEYNP